MHQFAAKSPLFAKSSRWARLDQNWPSCIETFLAPPPPSPPPRCSPRGVSRRIRDIPTFWASQAHEQPGPWTQRHFIFQAFQIQQIVSPFYVCTFSWKLFTILNPVEGTIVLCVYLQFKIFHNSKSRKVNCVTVLFVPSVHNQHSTLSSMHQMNKMVSQRKKLSNAMFAKF